MTANPNDVVLPTSQVSELLQSLVKALRAFQMYLPNNPMYQRASQNVRAGFAPIWPVLDDLVLQVAETDFIWEEQVVYHQLTEGGEPRLDAVQGRDAGAHARGRASRSRRSSGSSRW